MVKTRLMTINDWDGAAEVWENHEGTNPVDDSVEGFTERTDLVYRNKYV